MLPAVSVNLDYRKRKTNLLQYHKILHSVAISTFAHDNTLMNTILKRFGCQVESRRKIS